MEERDIQTADTYSIAPLLIQKLVCSRRWKKKNQGKFY